jgi:AraC-like DNA-binding protein
MQQTTPILELGDPVKNIPFEIHTMEWIEKNRAEQNSIPHKHNYFVILWIRKGSGTHLIDLDKFEIQDDTVYCLTPGQVHLLKADAAIEGYVISFTSEFFCLTEDNYDLLFNTGLFYKLPGSGIRVTEEMVTEMLEVTQKMMKEYSNFFLLRSEILRGFLKIFLIYLTRQYHTSDISALHMKSMELVKNFLDLLEKNFIKQKTVSYYADALSVTPNHLNETVKKITSVAASDHIKQRIILEAKRHAIYTDTSMKEIAFDLGFDDLAHFSKYFKNGSGINFTDYKKEVANHLG